MPNGSQCLHIRDTVGWIAIRSKHPSGRTSFIRGALPSSSLEPLSHLTLTVVCTRNCESDACNYVNCDFRSNVDHGRFVQNRSALHQHNLSFSSRVALLQKTYTSETVFIIPLLYLVTMEISECILQIYLYSASKYQRVLSSQPFDSIRSFGPLMCNYLSNLRQLLRAQLLLLRCLLSRSELSQLL